MSAGPSRDKPGLMDRLTERMLRRMAMRGDRRSLLARAGAWTAASTILPVLPVSRAMADPVVATGPDAGRTGAHAHPDNPGAPTPFAARAQTIDPTACDYWRYCAIDGYLCAACGGGVHSCPPGTQPSATSWIGTCYNPADRQSYLVAYRDCCGQDACSKPACLGTEGDEPSYRPQSNNDIIWCFGTGSLLYNCSTSVIVGNAS